MREALHRHRVGLAASLSLIVVALATIAGGVPFALAMGIGFAFTVVALPRSPRRYILGRLGKTVLSIMLAMAVVWILVHNYPDASRLDEPGLIPSMERYVDWIGDLVAGEMGPTQYSESVGDGVSRTLPISLQLVAYSQVIALAIAIPGAIIGALVRGRISDVTARGVSLLGLSVPIFVSGPLLAQLFGIGRFRIFGLELGWNILPVVRYVPVGDGVFAHLESMVLPSVTLGFSTAAVYLVLLRSELLQQMRSPHVELARSKGLSRARIARMHSLRPASPSVVTAVAAHASFVLGNVIIIERIFVLPGFGDYTLIAIGRRDVLAVAGALFVAAAILAVVNLIAETLLLVLDPRLDTGR